MENAGLQLETLKWRKKACTYKIRLSSTEEDVGHYKSNMADIAAHQQELITEREALIANVQVTHQDC